MSQYIGEVCHYLLSSPEVPEEQSHRVRLMFGNGLRASVWTEFARRFAVRDLYEVYGSTEGNTNLLNVANRPGACGFLVPWVGQWLQDKLLGLAVIRVDRTTGEPIRRPDNGLCIRARPGKSIAFP